MGNATERYEEATREIRVSIEAYIAKHFGERCQFKDEESAHAAKCGRVTISLRPYSRIDCQRLEAPLGTDVTITCDGCGNDLSETSNCEDYRLALINERVPNRSGLATLMGVSPAIKSDAAFCGVDCLRKWLDENYPSDKAPYHGGKAWAEYQRKQRAAGEPRQWK